MTTRHSAKDIVQEALDTIKATYWVRGAEFKYAESYNWKDLDKAIDVKVDKLQWTPGLTFVEDNKVKVVGVCSIGALALANMTLYDEPLNRWETISARDKQSWLAGAAVAMTVLEMFGTKEGEFFEPFEGADPANIIISWNDREDRTRADVAKAFKKALDHPMLTARNAWAITVGSEPSAVVFPTRDAARAFLASNTKLRKKLTDWADDFYGGEYVFDVVKVDLPG